MSARDLANTHHASLAAIPQAALTNCERLLFQRRIQICRGICLASRGLRDDSLRRKMKRERERGNEKVRFHVITLIAKKALNI